MKMPRNGCFGGPWAAVERVVDEKVAHNAIQGPVVVDGCTPGRVAACVLSTP